MKKYKLIKEYPGSPTLGEVVVVAESSTFYFYEKPDLCRIVIRKTLVDNQPDYWEEVEDNIWYMVSLTDMPFHNAWEPIKGDAYHNDTEDSKYFKTKEEADHFILYNKPCLSINEIGDSIPCTTLDRLIRIVKSKL